ncbi:MAG: HAD family hydrolase [Candidatus Doudnabacteria bacterium]|nr:HAD family hydrolase [Candidatus Doudnabacteria bacterium]
MIKLVAFDWNGTLLADTQISVDTSNISGKKFDLKPIGIQKFRQIFHIPISHFWKAIGGEEKDLDNQAKNFHPIYESLSYKSRTRAGSKEILKWLKQKSIKRMIYSNHIAPDIIKQLMRLDIFEYFDEVLARSLEDGHTQVHQRSKDQKLYDYVRRNKLKPREVLTIGDTEEEIEIGKKYGFHTVAITGGYNTTARLKKHRPDFLIHNMLELKKIIKSLNS